MEKITERNKHNRTSKPYTKLSAQVRSSMKQFSGDVEKLKNGLIRATSSYHITQREVDRRQGMMDKLITKEKHLETAFRNEGGESRAGLMAGGSDDPWGVREEPAEFHGIGNMGLRDHQQQIIREILDDIIDHTDRTGQRLIKETRHIRIVDRKSATCGFWVVIILLFVAIIVVAVVPGGKSL
ncbi:STX8-like protein [Mya arenaria]|uniref:STX8-like protein n=1 Tax=Mya arenaria TaxID=6604 RepID=A0ABY7DEI6_MYAAR|nr:STX8-like protein [Mya arenaria]WAQ96076.1 STX8-like protein [Mya arenaria]